MKLKPCRRCNLGYLAKTNSIYCPDCRRPAKYENEQARLRNTPAAKEGLRRAIADWKKRNPDKVAASFKQYYEANRDEQKARSLKYHYDNHDKMRRKRELQKYRDWGLTEDQYKAMLVDQGGGCAICGSACISGRALAIDHDHKTHVIRGLLCGRCNNGLGNFLDNPDLLLKAASYLESHRTSDLQGKGILS